MPRYTFPELPNWHFDLNEVSNGVWEMTGRDRAGRNVAAKGTDLDELLDWGRNRAADMQNHVPRTKPPNGADQTPPT